jgi:hypothetical protein
MTVAKVKVDPSPMSDGTQYYSITVQVQVQVCFHICAAALQYMVVCVVSDALPFGPAASFRDFSRAGAAQPRPSARLPLSLLAVWATPDGSWLVRVMCTATAAGRRCGLLLKIHCGMEPSLCAK